MLEVFFLENGILLKGNEDGGHFHRHYPYQLVVCFDQEIIVGTTDGMEYCSNMLLIDSNVEHVCRDHGNSISLFFDPESEEGKAFRQKFISDRVNILPLDNINYIKADFEAFRCSPLPDMNRAVLLYNTILHLYVDRDIKLRPTDTRIRQILEMLPTIPDKKISVKELAAAVYLSETRLIHLFKENMGIPIRRFLLWKRLLDAVKLIQGGETFTMSAIEAGFADYAHFSRTFKGMFGSSVESIFKNDRFVHVYSQ